MRTGPDAERLRARDPELSLRRGRRYLAAYIGVMGPQDGVDIVLRAADMIIRRFGRNDIAFTLIGKGDCYEELLELRDTLGLGDAVEFTGRAPDDLGGADPVDRGHRTVPRPEEPAERRVDDEQDDGVHGLRPASGRVRPARDAGVGRRGRRVREAQRDRGLRPQDRRVARRRTSPQGDGESSRGPGSKTSSHGTTSARLTSVSTTDCSGVPGERARSGPLFRPSLAQPDGKDRLCAG